MRFQLFTADCCGRASNCFYPNRVEVDSAEKLKDAVRQDHVCAEYRNNYRSKENFLGSDVIVMDLDNEEEVVTVEDLEKIFPDLNYALVPSRHHMIPKGRKPAVPRYHVFFPITPCTDAGEYTGLKEALAARYTFFDSNALDAARFLFGSSPQEVVWHDGWVNADELEVGTEHDRELAEVSAGVISEGSRNKTMSLFAGKVLKRYGDTEKSHEIFLDHARRCDPPLDRAELDLIWSSALQFYKKILTKQPDYINPDTYNNDFAWPSLKPEDYSDIGEAKAFLREYGAELRFTAGTDFLRYDGTHWKESDTDATGLVEEFMDLQLADAQDSVNSAAKSLMGAGVNESLIRAGGKALERCCSDNDEIHSLYLQYVSATTYLKFTMKYRNYSYIVATLSALRPLVATDVRDLDRDAFLLNTPAATYDLRYGLDGAQQHNSEDLITRITSTSPSEEGEALWKEALNTFFCGDQDLIDYVQRIVGMAAVGKVYMESLIIAYGEGRNGKSTFWNVISRVLGTYAGNMSADTLTVGCRRNVKPEIAELKGRRLIIAAELEEGTRLSTSILKQICSTDLLYAEKKYKAPFAFTPSHTVVLYTNHLPRVGAIDAGTWRRIIVIPFNAKIEGSGDIKNYADELYQLAAPAILSWIIEGARLAFEAGFHIHQPRAVEEAFEDYYSSNDWLGQFLEDCCTRDSELEQRSGQLYEEYRAYCARNGEYARGTNDFYKALEKAGFQRKKKKTGVWVLGLKLKAEEF